MITLITGSPGTGKTAWLVNFLFQFKSEKPYTLLFVHGVRNLRGILFEEIYCKSQLCDLCVKRLQEIPDRTQLKYVENWHDWKQPDSLIVVDEVQRIWRPRNSSSQPPESISALETHRHYGIDFMLLTQSPKLFDTSVRELVGRHIHLVSKWNGRIQYEWPECKTDISSRSDAVALPYSLPSNIYNNYDSAEVHTKHNKRKPLSFYFVILFLFISVVSSFYIYKRINSRVKSDISNTDALKPVGTGEVGLPIAPVPTGSFPDFKPSIEGLPESAPAYTDLIKVNQAPVIIGCVKTPTTCKCYSKQAVKYETSKMFCEEYMKGNYFNPYKTATETKSAQPERS